MSSLSQFVGGQPSVASVVNKNSTSSAGVTVSSASNVKILAAATLVAGTLQTALTIPSGRGTLNICHAQTSNATSKSVRLKVTIDGRVIFDSTSSVATNSAVTAVGFLTINENSTPTYMITGQPIAFKSSLLVEVASSVTEATGINTMVNYEVNV